MIQWPDLTFPPLNLWNFPNQPNIRASTRANLHKEHKMQISLTDANGTYSIFLNEDFDLMDDYIECLIKPILRAASFSDLSIDKYFVKEEENFSWDNMPLFEEKPVAKKAV